MDLISTTSQVFTSFLVFVLGGLLIISVAKKMLVTTQFSLAIYLWHTVFCIVYLIYTLKNPADAKRYFNSNNLNFIEFSPGTKAVELLTSLLRYFDLSYLGCFLFFNIIGTIGLLAFAGALKSVTYNSNKKIKIIALILILLPSVSFWSAGIGKDAISFMATGLALWAALNLKKRQGILVFSILAMLLVRPHIAGMMLIALSIAILFDKNVNLQIKIGLTIFSIIASAVMVPYALKYAGVGENVNAEKLEGYFDKKQNHNLAGGSSLDITSMPLPVKMFTYLFRPLPHEAHNITALLASLDNIMILLLFVISIKHLNNKKLKLDLANRKFLWFFAIITLIILSLTTANLGIAMRQKWMFMPMFIYLLISALALSNTHHKKSNE